MFPKIVFGQSDWLIPLVIGGLALACLVVLSYRRLVLPASLKAAAVLLKLAAVALLTAALLNPMTVEERPKSQANIVAIMVDSSRSMNALIGDRDSRLDSGKLSNEWMNRLSSSSVWQQSLEDDFRVRRFTFGSQVQAVDALDGLMLNETGSAVNRSLESIIDRMKGTPTAGIVLLTDGQATDSPSADDFKILAAKDLGIPIYPVDLGVSDSEPDLRLTDVTIQQSDFEAAPVTIRANVEGVDMSGGSAVVRLVDESEAVVDRKEFKLSGRRATHPYEFRFRPRQPGVEVYRLEVFDRRDEKPAGMSAARSEERDSKNEFHERCLANNRRTIVVDRGYGPYKILYLAGRPNWEHKFLQRAILEDAELKMISLIRIAKKEPKFSFRDTKVDSANPLFAGFEDVGDDEKEQYNEPVFVRLGIDDFTRHQKGFPRTEEELFEYNAVILDDVEHDFFSADQQSLLRRFVSIRGGGLLVLGGTEIARGKGFRESVLAQLLPIYGEEFGDSIQNTAQAVPAVRYRLTREGWLQPFLRTADNEALERKRIEAMPPYQVLNRAGGLKPGSSILSEVRTGDEVVGEPAFVIQRFGKGRSAALLVGDFWRWGLHHDEKEPAPLAQAWRQMVRWLIADVPKAIEMKVAPAEESPSGRASELTITARSFKFEPIENATVELEIEGPTGETIKGRAEASASVAGVYHFPFLTAEEGAYRATAKLTDTAGEELGECKVGWVHEPSVRELGKLGSNRVLLEDLARTTGGEMIKPPELETLTQRISGKPAPITETEWKPLWNRGIFLGLIVGCLAGEWWIRRRNGLP